MDAEEGGDIGSIIVGNKDAVGGNARLGPYIIYFVNALGTMRRPKQ